MDEQKRLGLSKTFKTVLILNYKTGKFRILKRFKSNMIKGTEVPIELSLDVFVPQTPILQAKGAINLTEMQISKLALSELEHDESIDDD